MVEGKKLSKLQEIVLGGGMLLAGLGLATHISYQMDKMDVLGHMVALMAKEDYKTYKRNYEQRLKNVYSKDFDRYDLNKDGVLNKNEYLKSKNY